MDGYGADLVWAVPLEALPKITARTMSVSPLILCLDNGKGYKNYIATELNLALENVASVISLMEQIRDAI